MVYRDRLDDIQTLYHDGFTKFIESKRYLQVRKKYLEIAASFPNRKLDARVNTLLQQGNKMENKERSPRKERKKPKKKNKWNTR